MCFFPHATPMDGTGVDSGRCYAAGTGGRRSPYVQAPVPAPPPACPPANRGLPHLGYRRGARAVARA